MRYPPSALKNLSRVLPGFNKVTTTSLSDVILPIQVDLATFNVRFSIVEDLLPYNAILGWLWLHKMKVISSTYHQMVSYLMENGQVNLHGSQLAW